MTVEARNAERLAVEQRLAIAGFFGAEVPTPPDRLLEVAEEIRKQNLFEAEPYYLPGRPLRSGLRIPGLKIPLNEWFFSQVREGRIAEDADMLSGQWVMLDVSRRPNYDNGKQMYSDDAGIGEILADLRGQGKIEVPDYGRKIPRNSRFAISADEIDGKSGVVAKAVASILSLQSGEQATTPPYAAFNYIGNMAHPEFGQANTSEWFADRFVHGCRLYGGGSGNGGLASVGGCPSEYRFGSVGFRLQVSFPSRA